MSMWSGWSITERLDHRRRQPLTTGNDRIGDEQDDESVATRTRRSDGRQHYGNRLLLLCALVLSFHGSPNSSVYASRTTTRVKRDNQDATHQKATTTDAVMECPLYLSETALFNCNAPYPSSQQKAPHQARFCWGGFAGQSFRKGHVLERVTVSLYAPQDVNTSAGYKVWDVTLQKEKETTTRQYSMVVPGLGTLLQEHAYYANVELSLDVLSVPDHAVVSILISQDVEVGQELFLGYYDNNSQGQSSVVSLTRRMSIHDNLNGNATRAVSKMDYQRADEIVHKLATKLSLNDPGEETTAFMTEVQWIDFLHRMSHEMYRDIPFMPQLLPKSLADLKRAAKYGTASLDLTRVPSSSAKPSLSKSRRSVCFDTFPKISDSAHTTLQRRVNKRASVSAIPLVPITKEDLVEGCKCMHDFCFGHPASNVCFCPLGDVGRILQHDGEASNVVLEWAGDKKMLTMDTHSLLSSFAQDRSDFRLVLELIATRDIDPGETIRLDFGNALTNVPGTTVQIPSAQFPSRWRQDYQTAKAAIHTDDLIAFDRERGNFSFTATYEAEVARKLSCTLYLAPSMIPNAGMGTYSSCPGSIHGATVLSSSASIVVPLDVRFDIQPWMAHDYSWGTDDYGAEYESSGRYVQLLSGGIGALSNSHPGFSNIFKKGTYRPLLDRRFDPGAGAFSDYESSYIFAVGESGVGFAGTDDCGEPTELLIDYGEKWFLRRAEFRSAPRRDDFHEVDNFVSSLAPLILMDHEAFSKGSLESLIEMTSTLLDRPKAVVEMAKLFSHDDFRRAAGRGGSAAASLGESRTSEWLEKNGRCLDHLYLKPSTIRQAGRGAFTRRPLKEGSTIVSSPLLPIFNTHLLDDTGSDTVNSKKLLLNYCLGHQNSSTLFLPTTMLTAINHAGDGMSTNAKLVWATWDKKSSYYLRRPIEDLKQERSSTVIVDVIATKDIAADEEVFIDYGREWDQAWRDHVRTWKSPCEGRSDHCFKSSLVISKMNLDKFENKFLRWSKDHFSVCYVNLGETQYVGELSSPASKPVDTLIGSVPWNHEGFFLARNSNGARWPCQILGSDPKAKTFDALIFSVDYQPPVDGRPPLQIHMLTRQTSIPAEKLQYTHKPLTSDMFWKGGFRHHIDISNIFPRIWDDIKSG